jgi:hypothetical protein
MYVSSPYLLLMCTFFTESYVLISTKNGLGYTLGNFFTNSSGHPAHEFVTGFRVPHDQLAPKLCDNVDDAIKDIKVVFALYVHSFELHTST